MPTKHVKGEKMEEYIKIDYENVPAQSKNIRNGAIEVNNKLLESYRKIAEMHVCWYGKRYNELVTYFNELVPQLNQFLNVIVGEVPYMFEKIANTISDVDIQQNVAVPQKESIQKLEALPLIGDVGMRYISKEVDEISNEIMQLLQAAEDSMESVKRTVDNVELECEGSAEFKNEFTTLNNAFEYVINNIKTQFTKLMQADRELMEKAEKENSANN